MKLVFYIFIIIIPLFSYNYEHYFEKYSKWYFGYDFDYTWFIAQGLQESRLDSSAVSYVGASGVMQIMPATWNDLNENKFNVFNPQYNIMYGIKYDRRCWNIWKAPRPFNDRISFMLGSYNAGAGHLIKAQKKALQMGFNPNAWVNIEVTLPSITGRHSKETITYVKRIFKYHRKINGL